MPEIIVKIEWDKPDEVTWLPPSNVELCLNNVCGGTKFKVTPYKPPNNDRIFIRVGHKEMSLASLADLIVKKEGT